MDKSQLAKGNELNKKLSPMQNEQFIESVKDYKTKLEKQFNDL